VSVFIDQPFTTRAGVGGIDYELAELIVASR